MKKGDSTKQLILQQAISMTSKVGLEALSIGKLAKATNMSKSGLFAHFSSKEKLQVEVLKAAESSFIQSITKAALAAQRGEPRIRAVFERWLEWSNSNSLPGGCIFISSAMELAGQTGVVKEFLLKTQKDWMNFLAGAARIAIEEKHFREDLDVHQFSYEFFSIALTYQYASRLINDKKAETRARKSLESLIQAAK